MAPPPLSTLLLPLIATMFLHTRPTAADNGGTAAVELWCVAKNNAEDAALQSALNWACGQGGANCGPIQQGGACYHPADILTTASYAFNSYFLKNGLTEESCNFADTAALTSLNPSHGRCKFPSSFSVNNGSYTGSPANTGFSPFSADISSATRIAITLFWSLITISYLFYAILLRF